MRPERSAGARLATALVVGLVVLAAAVALSLVVGAGHFDLGRALGDAGSPDAVLLFEARLPRVLLSVVCGSGLGAAGAALQALLKNPLADPYVLGTSGGAALFAAVAVALGVTAGIGSLFLPLCAFAGAVGASALVFALARRGAAQGATGLVLAGVVVNALASAAITLVQVLAVRAHAAELLFWLVGAIGYERWPVLGVAGACVGLGVVTLSLLAFRLNLLGLGDETAATLGVGVRRVRLLVLGATALITGAVVALCGLVGFVGLVVPHGVRFVTGPDHRVAIPASALAGAVFVVLADTLARAAAGWLGTEPPVGAITALIGCPLFLWLLVRPSRQR